MFCYPLVLLKEPGDPFKTSFSGRFISRCQILRTAPLSYQIMVVYEWLDAHGQRKAGSKGEENMQLRQKKAVTCDCWMIFLNCQRWLSSLEQYSDAVTALCQSIDSELCSCLAKASSSFQEEKKRNKGEEDIGVETNEGWLRLCQEEAIFPGEHFFFKSNPPLLH